MIADPIPATILNVHIGVLQPEAHRSGALFVVALFEKGFTRDLLLEAAVFLASAKLGCYLTTRA